MKRILKITVAVILGLLLLSGALTYSLRFPAVQNYVVQRVAVYVSDKLGTKVSIGHFSWNLFRNVDLDDFLLADKKGDTLVFAHQLNVDVSYWSLFNQKVKIDQIALDGARIHIVQKPDGTTNLTDLIAAKDPAYKKKSDPFKGSIQLKAIGLTNTDFLFEDQKGKGNYHVLLKQLAVNMNSFDLNKKKFDIHEVLISGLQVRIDLLAREIAQDSIADFHFLKNGWTIRWDRFRLEKGFFALNDFNKEPQPKGIDFGHLSIDSISLLTNAGSVDADTILATITGMHAREKSGFAIRELKSDARVSTVGIALKNLNLQTDNSRIGNNLAMNYNSFSDFKNFMTAVYLKADFDRTRFALKDLNYFLKKLDPVQHNVFLISGKISGKVSNLQGKDLDVRTALGTRMKGDFFTRGLPNLQETSINLRIKEIATNVYDVRYIYPSAKFPPNFNTLGNIRFSGDFDGFISDFVTRGKLQTSIGSASSDINFKYNSEKAKSAYSGTLALQEFDLGEWFGNTENLGKVSLSAVVKGTGIKLETIDAKLNGTIQDITLKGHTYRGSVIDGQVRKESFAGTMVVHDEHLDMDFNGLVDFSKNTPQFRFRADVKKAELRELNLFKDTLNIDGLLQADFTGKKVDDLVGSVVLENVRLQRGTYITKVKQAVLSATLLPDREKLIQLKTDQAEGEVRGRFSYAELPKVFRNYVNSTFTKNYEENTKVQPQQFTFDLRIYDSIGLARIVVPKLRNIRNSVIRGNVNSSREEFNVEAFIPEAEYDKYKVRRLDAKAVTAEGKINVVASADQLFISDSLKMDTLVVKAVSQGDDFRFDLIAADKTFYNRANITAYLVRQKGSADIHFDPSEVWLGKNKWTFREGNVINIKGKQITSHGLFFESGKQSVQVDAFLKGDTSTSVRLQLTETSLADFLGIFNKTSRDLKATVNGEAVVEDVFAKPAILADIEARQLTLGNELLGDLTIKSGLDQNLKRVNVQVQLRSEKNEVTAGGTYGIADNDLDIDVNLGSASIGFLNHPFFIKYVKNCSGTVRGNVQIRGTAKAPVLKGRVTVDDATVTVSFLNTQYSLHDEDIELRDGVIDIGNVTVYDRFNNQAFGSGKITHDHFKKITFDLHVNTQNAEFLNTTMKMMPNFYGNAFGRGKIDFLGTLPNIDIRASVRVNKGTHCYIPVNSSYETNRYAFYKFVNPAKDTLVKVAKRDYVLPTGVNFILDLDVTPDGIVDIQLDPVAGDVLSSSGRGNLKIEILRTGEFNIYGLYEIVNGNYLFTLQNIINKRFTLEKGGTIRFNGDIYHAQLNADAVYDVRTSVYDLISDQIADNSGSAVSNSLSERAKNRVLVKLLLNLQGILQSPEVSFDIRVMDSDPLIRNYVDSKMQLVKSADAEMNKQVFGLLVMNRFLPTNNSIFGNPAGDARGSAGNLVGGGVTNTVSEFLSSQLSHYVSNLFDNLNVHDLDFNFNFRQYDQTAINSTGAQTANTFDTRRELQLALSKRFFNNRLSVSAGGNLDFGDNKQYVDGGNTVVNKSNANITGDFQIEYVLDKNGVWRAKAFNRGDYDNFYQKNRNRTGVGIAYRQDFDTFRELFHRKRKPKVDTKPPSEGTKPKDTKLP
ncbi:MAG: translocation/assembly module TamB domain-containing protein [Chitinophagales bacterium]